MYPSSSAGGGGAHDRIDPQAALAARDRFGERLSENSRGPTTSCTSMTRSRFCAGPFRS